MMLQVRDLMLVVFVGGWVVFVMTGLMRGWGTGFVMVAAVWLVLLGVAVKGRR
jgi:hypothetical protein